MVRSGKYIAFLLTHGAVSVLLTNVFDTSFLVEVRDKIQVKQGYVRNFISISF